MAQALTLDTHAASDLVERAYRDAYAEDVESWPDDEVRERLIRRVLAAHRSAGGTSMPGEPDNAVSADSAERRGSRYRAQVARDTIDRLLPTALALLPERLRTTLVLMETENLSASDAARILESEASVLHEDRETAYRLLREGLMRGAGEVERELLRREWREEWLHQALVRHVRTRFAPPPPTLVLPRPDLEMTADALAVRYDHHEPADRPRANRWRIRKVATALAMVVGAGLIGYAATALFETEPDQNIVTLSASRIGAVNVAMQSDSASDIESFLREEYDRVVKLPNIEQASLLGAGTAEVTRDVFVPVVLYKDNDGEQIPLFVYSYALLDSHSDALRLERDVMQQIEDERHFDLHDLGDARVLIWRSRDEIFLAATRGDASELQDRIQPLP